MLATNRRQMLAEALRIGHAHCVVLVTIERHTDTFSSGWFHGSDSLYGAVCSIHSIGVDVESSYCLHRFFTNHEIRWNQEQEIARGLQGLQKGERRSVEGAPAPSSPHQGTGIEKGVFPCEDIDRRFLPGALGSDTPVHGRLALCHGGHPPL